MLTASWFKGTFRLLLPVFINLCCGHWTIPKRWQQQTNQVHVFFVLPAIQFFFQSSIFFTSSPICKIPTSNVAPVLPQKHRFPNLAIPYTSDLCCLSWDVLRQLVVSSDRWVSPKNLGGVEPHRFEETWLAQKSNEQKQQIILSNKDIMNLTEDFCLSLPASFRTFQDRFRTKNQQMAEGSIPSHQPFSKDAQSMDASTAKSMRKGGVCQGEMGHKRCQHFFWWRGS